jgi:hypothetical protein
VIVRLDVDPDSLEYAVLRVTTEADIRRLLALCGLRIFDGAEMETSQEIALAEQLEAECFAQDHCGEVSEHSPQEARAWWESLRRDALPEEE